MTLVKDPKKDNRFIPAGRVFMQCLTCAAVLSGCGGTGQDDGQISTTSQQFSGAVIDGYLARSTVFIDANNNGTRDAWEPFAFTDNNGYYSYNPITQTDYCTPTATPQQQQYCLESVVAYDDVVIRVDGGYDVLTGEPFLGQMTRRISSEESASDHLISPITSLFTSARTEDEKTEMLDALGLTTADLDVDYLNEDGQGSINSQLLNTALTIHKTVTVLSDRLTDTYTEIGENFGTPNDASSAVYPALAQAVSKVGLDDALRAQSLFEILDSAEEQLRDVYTNKKLTLPQDLGSSENPSGFSRIADIVSDIPSVVDALVDTSGVIAPEDVAGKARALESLVLKAVQENNRVDTSIGNAVDFFTTVTNEPLIGALVESLGSDTGDLSLLSTNDFIGGDFDSVLEIAQSSSVAEGVEPFSGVGGMTLRLADLDLGTAPARLDDSEIEFYFSGSADDAEGSFQACVKVIDDANIDGTLSEGDFRGEYAEGFWSLLGLIDGGNDAYNLLVTINLFGATYQGIIKAAGFEMRDGINYQAIRFDNDGKLETWYSEAGFLPSGNDQIPGDNAACEDRLPSRIGI